MTPRSLEWQAFFAGALDLAELAKEREADQLRRRGLTDSQIAKMGPEERRALIAALGDPM